MQQRHHDRLRYFQELSNTSRDFYVDYVGRFVSVNSSTRVLEIGCGEGGNLLPFAQLGCYVKGIDLDRERTEQARKYFVLSGQKGEFVCQDFLTFSSPNEGSERFDIILIHDVIEHIPPSAKYPFFFHIRSFLRRGGIVFFGFPAWHNPFGGHQQISVGIASKLPFIHLLPNVLYTLLLRFSRTSPAMIEELLAIKQARMTIERFEQLTHQTGYTIVDRQLWFINPHYQQKFHLKPRRLWSLLARVPYVRNYFTTSAFYVISL